MDFVYKFVIAKVAINIKIVTNVINNLSTHTLSIFTSVQISFMIITYQY